MGQITGAEHGPDDGGGVERVAGLGGRHGKEAEGIGIEAVELALVAEAGDDGLGAREGHVGVLVGQLGDQATKASGAREVSVLSVGYPGLLCFSLTEESEECLV